jgi:multiple sugar transport system permease protein
MAARSPGRRLASAVVHRLTIVAFVAFAVFPFYWMVITTFKQNADLYVGATNTKHNPFIFNRPPTLEHLATLFGQTLYPTWLFNTLFVGVVVVLVTLLLAVPAGYSLARLTGRWGERLSIGIFMTYLVPTTLLFLPLVKVIAALGMFDHLQALILAYPTFTIPFCTWLMAGFFKTIPFEIEEAAMVDGCSRIGAIPRVVLPLSLAGILTVAIFAFTLSMQDFVYALTFVSSSDQKVVTIGVVTELIRGDVFFWGSLMAGALIAGIPVAILYSFFLDYFVRGITGGALK